MRLLIISYFYKPQVSARAFRWAALAERWAAQGHHVDVITGREGSRTPQEHIQGVRVYRPSSPIMGKLQAAQTATQATEEKPPSLWGRLMAWGYRHVWQRFLWPDAAFLWIGPAVRQGRALMGANRYDALITVAPFFSAHLVGERLYDGRLHWLADYGDPFALQQYDQQNNNALYARRNHRVEGRVLRQVDAAAVTTELTAELYAEAYPHAASKISVVPPLVPTHPHPEAESHDAVLRLLYAGAFYPTIRRPDYMLRLFGQLVRHMPAELHIYGDTSRVQEAFDAFAALQEDDQLRLHGTMPHGATQQAMAAADVLVNLGNQTAHQLPSKVVEYASTGKPILNIAPIRDDSSSRVLATYPNALTLYEGDPFDDNLARLSAWLHTLPEVLTGATLATWLAPFQLEAVGAAYDELIGL